MARRFIATILLVSFSVASALGCRNQAAEVASAPLIDAEEYPHSDVLPFLAGRIETGRNYIYCGTFDLAWDELCAAVGEPVELQGAAEWSQQLNGNPFDKSQLVEDSYLAIAGRVDENVVADIRRQMTERFPNATMGVPEPTVNEGIYAYAYLAKSLRFRQAFEELHYPPLKFQSADGVTSVSAFGVKSFNHETDQDDARTAQVSILDYVSDDDFVLQLTTTNHREQLVLAKVSPLATLGETVAAVQERIQKGTDNWDERLPREGETLVIPVIGLRVERQFDEIVGRKLLNTGWERAFIAQARQAIRFRLDAEGAEVESIAEVAAAETAASEEPEALPKLRQFIFDKPFLVMLTERDATQPYFAMWVANPEILER